MVIFAISEFVTLFLSSAVWRQLVSSLNALKLSFLIGHTTEKGMDGLFYYLGQKEAEIRENPVEQTTDLLKKVFGQR